MHLPQTGPCEHGVLDDICFRCTLGGRRFPVSKPSLTIRERTAVNNVMTTGQITQAGSVAAFEAALEQRLGVGYAIACSSGTTALHLALLAAGVGPGDEVLVPDLSFVATANAVVYCGATPVLCDIEPDRWSLDLNDAARKVSERTVAIIPVHLYGNPTDMDQVLAFADEFSLSVIEDAAEGFGAKWEGDPLGTIGDVGVFSFYGNKIITTGEGGAVVTNDGAVAERLRKFRGQGQTTRRYFHDVVGYNYRMTDLQAAIGLAQLERAFELITKRKAVVDEYEGVFRATPCKRILPTAAPWLFTFLVPGDVVRDDLALTLETIGIDTRPAFVPFHQLPMYARPDAQFPVATEVARRGLSLPTYPDLALEDARAIGEIVLMHLRRAGTRVSLDTPAHKETV